MAELLLLRLRYAVDELLLFFRFALDGLLLLFRSETDGLREPVLLLRSRFALDEPVLGVATPRSLDPDVRLAVVAEE